MEDKNFIYNLIALELTIGLDKQQKVELQSWLEMSQENRTEYNDVVKLLTYSDRLVAMKRINTDRDLLSVKKKLNRRPKKNTFFLNFQKAAAILLMPVLTFLLYVLYDPSFISSKKNNPELDSIEVIASAGARTIVQLSDGTEVNLNYGSKIKYPRNFIGDTRELRLSGEGFFNVSHDPKHPFIVKTKRINIKAVGTKFNVLTYPGNDKVETTLIEGKVVLEQSNENGTAKIIGSLIPGEHVDYNSTTGEISSTQGNVEKYVAWKDGILFFDNAPISDVAERLGRMYNVEIKVTDEIKDYTYTVKFVDESLSQILDLLNKATPVNYKMFPREKLPDGTYSKQKILFEKRQN